VAISRAGVIDARNGAAAASRLADISDNAVPGMIGTSHRRTVLNESRYGSD